MEYKTFKETLQDIIEAKASKQAIIHETWNSEDFIIEALNELGESNETQDLAEACDLLDLIAEATTSALEKPLRTAHQGDYGRYLKGRGLDRRGALLAKIRAKADEKRVEHPGSAKGRKESNYWQQILDRAAHLQARHTDGLEGREIKSPKRLAQIRRSSNAAEGARGKKIGDTWETTTGHHGGKNSSGEIRYFKTEAAARTYAQG